MKTIEINAGTLFQYSYEYESDNAATYKIVFMSLNNRYSISGTYAEGFINFIGTSSKTSQFDPGTYRVSIVQTINGEKAIIAAGRATINGNVEKLPTDDVLSHNEKMLASIRKRLEGRILSDHENYSVDGRSLSRISIDTLHELEKKYAWRLRHEQAARGERVRHKRIRFR